MRHKRRLTYANVVSTLALFLAIGGVGYAAAAWTGADIVDNSLSGADLARDSVGFDELASHSVGTLHVRNGAIRTHDLHPTAAAPNANQLDGIDSTRFMRDRQKIVHLFPVPALSTRTGYAECPPGKQPVGGGVVTGGDMVIRDSYPTASPPGWSGTVRNDKPYPLTAQTHVICVTVAD